MIFNCDGGFYHNKIPSLTEWMEKINLPNILEFRNEDNQKYSRLEKLHKIIGINYNIPEKIGIGDITKKFKNLYTKKRNLKCNIRIIPKTPNFPKLRIRATPFKEGMEWFYKQKIKPANYENIEIIKYNEEILYSAVFLINDFGIWGEAINGYLWQLAYGVHKKNPALFNFNFKKWDFDSSDRLMVKLIRQSIRTLLIDDENQKEKLENYLDAEFTTDGYLKGYFEFVIWPDEGTLFMDYNRVIYKLMNNFTFSLKKKKEIRSDGICANPGMAHGRARIINNPTENNFTEEDILICKVATIEHAQMIKKAKAIITEQGNILSHISIVSRELNKPCIVMAKDITKKIQNGDKIFIDATKGTIIVTSE